MDTIKSSTRKAFSGFAISLERAQRINKNKENRIKDEFILPMWISPEERNKDNH